MTPVEEMQAAGAKLVAERDAAGPAPWTAWRGAHPGYFVTQGVEDARGGTVAAGMSLPDAVLIETLHRTIDMLLTIIRHAIEDYSPGDDCQGFITEDGLALARQINGGA